VSASAFTPPKVLITGASGFIGSRLAHHMASQWQVTALVRPSSNLDQLELVAPNVDGDDDFTIDIETVEHTGDFDSLAGHLQRLKPDVVIHLASLYLAQHKPAEIPTLIQSNITFGTQLLEAMAATGITRLVNAGTGWQHLENAPYRPVNLYAATKQAFEDIMAYYCDAHCLRAITLKIFDSYGPRDPRPKLINALMRAAREQKPLELSPGDQQMEMVHVRDIARAFEIAATRTATLPAGTHERFALRAAERLTLKQLVVTLSEAISTPIPVNFGAKPYRPREAMVPWTDGVSLPGWSPNVPLSDGLRECYAV
jgi:nucleoside-diphosphate-sugar epimerase